MHHRPGRLLRLILMLLVGALVCPAVMSRADVTVEVYPDDGVRVVNDGTPLSNGSHDVGYEGYAEAEIAAVTVRFPGYSPATYIQGSGKAIDLIVDGDLPAGASLKVRAWHLADQEYADGFDVSLSEGNWTITGDDIAALSVGHYELQATISVPGRRPVQIAQRYVIIPEGLEDAPIDTWYDVPPIEEIEAIPDLVVIPGAGLIDFKPTPGAQTYFVSESGSDSNDGLSESSPLRTLAAAYGKVGDKDGDWILLKAGDTFRGGFPNFNKGGRSPEEPMLIGVYGSGDRPTVHTNGDGFIQAFGEISHVVLEGIHVYANQRDVRGAYPTGSAAKEYGIYWLASGKNITLQDMKIEGFKSNVVFQAYGKGRIQNVNIRRCIIIDSYAHYQGSKGGHSAGMYLDNVKNAVIDESFFDHNGWRKGVEGASRTMFNHNVYVQKNCENVNAYRSVFSRGSHHGIQLRCGGEIVNNLFVRNALQAFVAQAPSLMENNVALEADDMNPDNAQYHRGSGFEVLPCEHAIVRHNLAVDKVGSADWSGGIEVKYRDVIVDPPARFYVEIYNNTVVRWPRRQGKDSSIASWADSAEVVKRDNVLDAASGGSNVSFVDPSRTIHTYLPGGYDAFLDGGRNRARGSWDPVYGAATFNQWMREGYKVR